MTHYDTPSSPVKSEAKIQQEIVMYFRNRHCLLHHNPRSSIFSVPNGGSRHKGEAIMLQATGLLCGVSDLIMIHRGKILFIEVKRPGETQSQQQMEFEGVVFCQGFDYYVVTSLEDFQKLMKIIFSEY